jgi:hypothetical protein
MLPKFPVRTLARQVVVAAVIGGAAALGTGGAAFAVAPSSTTTTSITSSSLPAATHVTCARAPKALARITKVQGAITKRVAKLQADETKLTAHGHTKAAAKVESRITKLQKITTKAGTLAKKIDAKCPSVTAS